MRSERGEGRAAAGSVVAALLTPRSAVTVRARLAREDLEEQASRGAVAVVATEGDSPPARSMQAPMRSAIRDILSRFLELNKQVNEFVNRYVEVFVQQADGLTEWSLKLSVDRIAESITSLDRTIAVLLKTSDEAQVGPDESDRTALADYRDDLQRIRGSLGELRDGARDGTATPESRAISFDQLRNLTAATWGAATGIFKIASAIVTGMLDQMPQWGPASETSSEVFSASTRLTANPDSLSR